MVMGFSSVLASSSPVPSAVPSLAPTSLLASVSVASTLALSVPTFSLVFPHADSDAVISAVAVIIVRIRLFITSLL